MARIFISSCTNERYRFYAFLRSYFYDSIIQFNRKRCMRAKKLLENTWWVNKYKLTLSFIVQQFRFSDYYRVCHDIERFAISTYNEREAAKIKDKLGDILETLYKKFIDIYLSCYKQHPNAEIGQEICFMKLLIGDIAALEQAIVSSTAMPITCYSSERTTEYLVDFNKLTDIEDKDDLDRGLGIEACCTEPFSQALCSHKAVPTSFSCQSEMLLAQGTFYNDILLYKEAIQVLTQAIRINPSNRDAYIERAMAYFETNQFSLALCDYKSAKKLTIVPLFNSDQRKAVIMAAGYIPKNKTEFSKGLVSGTVEGAKISAVEFVPSIFSCCRGILNGLWAFVCSPTEVSQELVNTAYAIGEFISSHRAEECFQCVIPELKELSLTWDKLNDYARGKKIGFIIGKYGVDIFAPTGILKGMNKVRALKRANTMCTLENCVISQTKQAKILEESAKRAFLREGLAKTGHILTKTSNVQ